MITITNIVFTFSNMYLACDFILLTFKIIASIQEEYNNSLFIVIKLIVIQL